MISHLMTFETSLRIIDICWWIWICFRFETASTARINCLYWRTLLLRVIGQCSFSLLILKMNWKFRCFLFCFKLHLGYSWLQCWQELLLIWPSHFFVFPIHFLNHQLFQVVSWRPKWRGKAFAWTKNASKLTGQR